jgi:outer membrane lipoprotein carrier protein
MAATPQKPHPTKAVKDPKNNTAPKAKCLRYAAKPSCWYPCLKWKGKNCVERSKRRICRRKCLEWQKPNVPAPSAPIDPAPPKLIQPPSQLDAAISGIQRYYQEVESLCAQFKQIFTPARFTRSQEATGRFYYRKPAMLRFHYIKPERKDYIFNGDLKTLWMYYPEDSEVKIRNNVSRSDFGVAMQFLWGSGDLKKTFRIQQLQTPKFGQAGDLVIELIPHKQQAIFDKLYFAVMPDNHQVRETIYTDPAGNQNRFIFSQMVRNEQCSLPTSMFRFEPPKGVESIYIQ